MAENTTGSMEVGKGENMMNSNHQGSEVARLLRQIREEYESAQQGLTGLAHGTSQHRVITQKMENIGRWHEELQALVGNDAAMVLMNEHLETLPQANRSSAQ